MSPIVNLRLQPKEEIDRHNEDDIANGAPELPSKQLSVLKQKNSLRCDQPKYRSGCANGIPIGQQERHHISSKRTEYIQQQEASMPKLTFESTPKGEQRIHIEGDMRDRSMHQRGRKQAPELPCTDQVIVFGKDRTWQI